MNRTTYILLILISTFAASCKKDKATPLNIGYTYFPDKVGHWIIYDVTDIQHDITSDTFRYQIKEVIESKFIDIEGKEAMRIERYKRDNDTLPWVIKDVWEARLDNYRAEKTEENIKYIKMVFPVDDNQFWDGNVFNTNIEWEYFYEDIDAPYSLPNFNFDSTVKVVQRENFNAVEFENAYEIYAKNVGMIKKQLIDLDINGFNIDSISKGFELYQELIDFGD